jgi:hypothetical protein
MTDLTKRNTSGLVNAGISGFRLLNPPHPVPLPRTSTFLSFIITESHLTHRRNAPLISSRAPSSILLLETYRINCVYTFNIRAVKTQQTICEVVSQCNIQQYVKYNYMFRPCKRAIIRLFLEPVIRHIQWEYGGTRSRLYETLPDIVRTLR